MKKLRKIAENSAVRTSAGLLASFAGGFVLSGTSSAGVASFADISLTGALDLPYAVSVMIGAVVHGIVSDTLGRGIVKTAAMMLVVIAKLMAGSEGKPLINGIISGSAVMLSGISVSLLIGEFPQKLLFYGFYSALAGFAAYCGAELIRSLRTERVVNVRGLSGGCYAVIYIVYISALFSVGVPVLNVGFTLGAFVTAAAAYFYGGVGGIICGALTAFGAFLVSPKIGISASVLPAAGLFAGLIRKRSPFLTAAVFVMLCYSLSVLTGAMKEGADITLGVLCSAAVFAVTAPYLSDKRIAAGESAAVCGGGIDSVRADFLSDVIEGVRVDAARVSTALWTAEKKRTKPHTKGVCDACARNTVCRRFDSETAAELSVPERCVRKRELTEEFERGLRERTAEQFMKLRFSHERDLLNEQLKLTADILRHAPNSDTMRFTEGTAERIRAALEAHGIEPLNVRAYYNSSNRLIAELYFSGVETAGDTSRLRDLASDELDVNFTVASPVTSVSELRVCLYERPEYTFEVYSASVCAEGSEVSGDSSVIFTNSEGVCYAVLSDGMGTGKSASVDSHMVIGLFRRLVCGGMEAQDAVKLINSVMVNKSRDESFATFDAVCIDPDTCRMVSVKSGAHATLIRCGNDVIKAFAPAFPIGINECAEVASAEYELAEGDIVLMFSDGISESEFLFVKELLMSGDDVREIVRETAVKSSSFSQQTRSDDVTVIGIKIVGTP